MVQALLAPALLLLPALASVTSALVLLLLPTLPAIAAATAPASVEQEMVRLQRLMQERQSAADWDGALALVGEMAALDPDHPRPFIRLVLLQAARGALGDVPLLIERLGLREGPGRTYANGMLAFFGGDLPGASAAFAESMREYRVRGHAAGEAAGHTALGNVHSEARRFDEARREYEAALPLLESLGDRWGLADVHGNLAQVERLRGRPAEALAHQRRVLGLQVEVGDREGQARSWFEIGASLSRTGSRQDALAALERALALDQDLEDAPGQIAALREIARIHRASGRGDPSVARLEEALALARASGDRGLEPEVSQDLGESLMDLGRVLEGRSRLEDAAAAYRKSGDARGETSASISLGRALSRTGRHAAARELLMGALGSAEDLDDLPLLASACTALGNAYQATGEATRALVLHQRALDLHRRVEDREGERTALNNLGSVYDALGDAARSRDYLERALRLAEELGDPGAVARARNNLGVLLAREGRLEPALGMLEEALRTWGNLEVPRSEAITLENSAEVLLRLGRRDEAAGRIARALEISRKVDDREGEASVRNLSGDLWLATGEPGSAAAEFRRALDLARENGLPGERWRAHAGLAAAHAALGQRTAAFQEALRAVDEIERVRARLELDVFKVRFLAGKIRHYETALSILSSLHDVPPDDRTASSFRIAERARARGLVDLLAESGARLRDSLDPGLRARESEVLDALSAAVVDLSNARDAGSRGSARVRLAAAEEDLERLRIEIRRGAPRYGEIAYPRPASLEEIQREVLGAEETLLEYFIGESGGWVWVVDRRGASVHPLPPPEEIRSLASRFLDSVGSAAAVLGAPSADRAAAERLSRAVLPAAPLPAGRRLIVVPDGPLHHVPFEALVSNGRFLVEDHEIVVAPSATALGQMRRQAVRRSGGGFLGIADPILSGDDAAPAPLPHARREIEEIAGLFPEPERTILTGAAASKQALRAMPLDRFRFVHFATHGWLDADDLRRTGLRMSVLEGQPGSGLLPVEEIPALDLSAEAVVLSACRSGLGEPQGGEGLVSLTRAFLYAGAHAIVVSLWDVGDESTADLMSSFYRGIRNGLSPAASLRRAKLEFLRSERAGRRWIRAWAPFILVGDPGPRGAVVNRAGDRPTESAP